MPPNPESIHICLISAQPIPNLLPLLMEKPCRVILLVTEEVAPQAERLLKIIRPRGIAAEKINISPYDFGQVAAVCQKIVDTDPVADLTLNVTGGTKVAAMAAFHVFYFANKRIIYLDTGSDRILQLAPQESVGLVRENLIKAKDYLAAYGQIMTSTGAPPAGYPQRSSHLKDLTRLFVENEKLLGTFNYAIEKNWQGNSKYANIELSQLGDKGEELAELLCSCQVASRGVGVININGDDNRFFCQGGWFEEYVFSQVNGLNIKNCQPLINVEVKWDEKGRETTNNEFDIVFTNRNRLFIISCKTANLQRDQGTPGKNAIYELETLSGRAGGLFRQSMLASMRRPAEAVRTRAKNMNIRLIYGQDILNLSNHLRSWLA